MSLYKGPIRICLSSGRPAISPQLLFARSPSVWRIWRRYSHDSTSSLPPIELYDVAIVGGGPVGCALAGTLSSMQAFEGMRIALIDPGRLSVTRQWKPPLDVYLSRTLQITARNKRFLEKCGIWARCYTDRVQPCNRAVVTDALGHGTVDLAASGTTRPVLPEESVAYMIETKNFVSGLLQSIHNTDTNIDLFERVKVVEIDGGSDRANNETANTTADRGSLAPSLPVISLSCKRRLRARLLIGADGVNSCVRKYAGIGTYGTEYSQFGLVATLCLEDLNSTAYQRFLPTGPIAMLPFPGGFANLVWSLDQNLVQLLKTVPKGAFASLANAAFRLPAYEMEYLYGLARTGVSESEIIAEAKWRLEVFDRSRPIQPSSRLFPPTIAATSPRSRISFPLRMRMVDSLIANRVALVGDAGHVMHPLAGQGLNMGLEDVQCLVDILEHAVLTGEDIGARSVLSRYNKQRYVRNLAMQGIVDKTWHIFGASIPPVAAVRSQVMNWLDMVPAAKRLLVENVMA
ncbi:putative ubiquinone biosynthesis monooxygenase [Coemansia sp. RSA 1804]|nr:putative ubiquinone biosynthesis monooxygenase [Coemansia sp. RSA 1804]